MNRRKFLIGAGSIAAGTAAAMGTGAVTSVSAKREVSVDVVGDASAYLKLGSDGAYVSNDNDDEFTIDVGGSDGGPGLNQDAVTVIDSAFYIQNELPRDKNIQITLSYSGPGVVGDVSTLDQSNNEGVYFEVADSNQIIQPGEATGVHVGVVEDAGENADGVPTGTLTINAETTTG